MESQAFQNKTVKVVAIGGGNGLATLLSGLKKYVKAGDQPIAIGDLSAIVAVSDDGGSSGRLRDEFSMPPPGDIRNCMVALSEDSHLLSRLFRHRFSGAGDLGGHSFGNLFLAALAEVTGDFGEAVRLSSEVLASKGHIYPATDTDVRIAAELTDGSTVNGETKIGRIGGRIKRVYLEPSDCQPLEAAVSAIAEADLITVGPGSLYTSLLPPLLVKGLSEAVAKSKGVKIVISNLMTQPGETDGLSARRHIEILQQYAPDINFDKIIVNNKQISDAQSREYGARGSVQIGLHGSFEGVEIDGAEIVSAELLADDSKVRHDPELLAAAVLDCVKPVANQVI
jgi:uncharacterized cofD-like protein